MRKYAYMTNRLLLSVLLLGIVLLACERDRGQPDVGVTKSPSPKATSDPRLKLPPLPTATPPTGSLVPGAATGAPTIGTAQTLGISPDVMSVLDEMDQGFAKSKSRHIQLDGRIVMISSVKGYRSQFTIEMKLKFPNLMNIVGRDTMEVNDGKAESPWEPAESLWAIVCDGKQMVIKGPRAGVRSAPATLDDVLDGEIEIANWGSNALINSFLKTRPSDAFKQQLRGARVVRRSADQIDLELVTPPPLPIVQRRNLAPYVNIIQQITLDGRQMIPKRCRTDTTELTRDVYRSGAPGSPVSIKESFFEIVVTSANLNADFSNEKPFVIPK